MPTAGRVMIAGLALFQLNQGGDIDLSGEKHGALPSGNAVRKAAWVG